MLSYRNFAKLISLVALVAGLGLLWLGPYREYCKSDYAKDDYCAAYKMSVTFGHFLDVHSGAITTLATIAIAFFTWTLWRSNEKMWIATQQALRHAEETAERQLRAYVHISRAGIKFDPPESPEWHLEIKNFGQTPAYEVSQWTHIWITDRPLKEPLPIPAADFKTAKSILAPGNHEIMQWTKEPPIPTASLPLIGTPVGTIYIYGEIKYVDAFKKQRFTKYRLFFGDSIRAGTCMLMPDSEGNEAT
jgi:hypothetical protein